MTVNLGDKFTIPSTHSTECGGYDFMSSQDMVTVTVIVDENFVSEYFPAEVEGHVWHNQHHGDLVFVEDENGEKQYVSIEFLKSWEGI